ncbi:MAG: SCO family protein [Gammaproteobacteria bacterium]|nr:SCO family protein [Gammaproteobacteria bacterium]MBT7174258.1 SCO family protein [Gammaproteobacteria bacterium]MBT7879118.1 SCO family protein [Gammaproteobacteria bacterium]
MKTFVVPLTFLVCLSFSLQGRGDGETHPTGQSADLTSQQSQALERSQEAIGNRAAEYEFLDQDRRPVHFSDYLGKPLLVNFIFTSCHHTCPMMTANLVKVVDVARDAVGRNAFSVVTVGFDVEVDTPEMMRFFAVERGVDFDGWDFLSGDSEAIERITADLGFYYTPSASGFDHLAQSTVLDAEGKVYRQVYGQSFDPPALVEPLKELVFGEQPDAGKLSDWINGIKLFCTVYDPSSGKYYFDYSLFVSIGVGLICLFSIAFFVIKSWREHETNPSA